MSIREDQMLAAVLINMPIWRGLTFGDICMFSFGKNLAQALMKYSPIDPPAAEPRPTYGHCSTASLPHPSPRLSHYISRFKSSRALESGRGGLLSSQVALVVRVSNQPELKKADVSPNPGEVLRAAFRRRRGVKAHPKLSAMSLSRAMIAIILFFTSSFWLKCSSTSTPPLSPLLLPWHKTVCDILCPGPQFHNRWPHYVQINELPINPSLDSLWTPVSLRV